MFKPGWIYRGILVSVITFASSVWAYSGGNGSQANPFQIATATDLIALGQTSGDYGKSFILTANIDLSGRTFGRALIAPNTNTTAADFQGTPFSGYFDGNGKIISNLIIIGTNQDFIGLFGQIGPGGQIINLGLKEFVISGRYFTGGLCGKNNNSMMTQCYASGIMTGTYYAGILCGYSETGVINQCYAAGSVSSSGYAAGLCGINTYGSISLSYSTAAVTCGSFGAGLCAQNAYGSIISSYWDTQTSGVATSDGGWGKTTAQMKQAATYLGWNIDSWTLAEGTGYPRLLWENKSGDIITTDWIAPTYSGDGTPSDPFQIATADDLVCLSWRFPDWESFFVLTDDIDMTGHPFNHAVIAYGANFTGLFDGAGFEIQNLTITGNGLNFVGLFYRITDGGEVQNLGLDNLNLSGDNVIGGLCGENNYGAITNCFVNGSVTGTGYYVGGLCGASLSGSFQQCYTSGYTTGAYAVGGLCGNTNSGSISQCYSVNSVLGTNSYIGGLCGEAYISTIDQSYATGSVKGTDYIGGLCGAINQTTINQCYATGAVTGAVTGTTKIGGLCGLNTNGTVAGSFWDMQTTGQPLSAGGAGKTTTLLQTQATFIDAGWDFIGDDQQTASEFWHMPWNQVGYPLLGWQKDMPGDLAGGYGVDMADWNACSTGWLNQFDLSYLDLLAENWLAEPTAMEPQTWMAHWTFNVNGLDSVGMNHGALTNGALITHAAGEFYTGAGALKLDGIDDLVNCGIGPDINNMPVISISLWFKANPLTTDLAPHLACQRNQTVNLWDLYLQPAGGYKLSGLVMTDTQYASSISTFTPLPGVWYHVVMTYDDTSDRMVRLYVDGQEVSYHTRQPAIGARKINTTIPVIIGNRLGGDRPFGAIIDDVRIYRRVLTAAEIMALSE